MSKQPFMPLFFGDFLASTAEWSGEERALYLLLLSYQWSMGSLPIDTKRLAKLVDYERNHFDQHWPMVSTKFVERDDRLYNLRLETHRDRSIEIAAKRAKAGAIGGSRSAASRQHLPEERSSNGVASAEANAKDLLRHPSHPIPSHPDPESLHQGQRVSEISGAETHTTGNGAGPKAGTGAPPTPTTLARVRVFADPHEVTEACKRSYPKGTYTGVTWIHGERCIGKLLEDGEDPDKLVAAAGLYRDQQQALGKVGSQFVLSPKTFFGDGHWRGPFPLPAKTSAPIASIEEIIERAKAAQHG